MSDEQVERATLTCRSEEDVIVCPSLHWNIILHLLFLRFLITIPVGLQLSPGIDCWHLVFSIFFIFLFIVALKKKKKFTIHTRLWAQDFKMKVQVYRWTVSRYSPKRISDLDFKCLC